MSIKLDNVVLAAERNNEAENGLEENRIVRRKYDE